MDRWRRPAHLGEHAPAKVDRAVFLDRDGVLNALEFRDGRLRAPLELARFRTFEWAASSVAELKHAGLLSLVVTNQPDVASGDLSRAALDAMHDRLRHEVGIDAVYVCPHGDGDGCVCRKPKTGLIVRAAEEWSVDLSGSFMVGDGWRDVAAGRAAGCTTILVGAATDHPVKADHVVRDLREAVATILRLTSAGC